MQEQEEISPNHVQRLNLISVVFRAKNQANFFSIESRPRILVREQQLDLHDVPQFFHLDFKVVDNVFGSVEVPQEGAVEEEDHDDVGLFASFGDIRPRMADSLQDDDYDDLGLEQLEQGRKSQQIFYVISSSELPGGPSGRGHAFGDIEQIVARLVFGLI